MIALPAVDLKGGRCVQLVGGRPDEERISLPDPVEVARGWWDAGFRWLHVVDLDAALGDGDNRDAVAAVLEATPASAQVGGGVRDDEAVAALLEAGARRVVVGTRAVDDPEWLRAVARRHPGRVVVAADVRAGVVLRRGWTEASSLRVEPFLEGLADVPLAGVLCTDVAREGRMEGIDLTGVRTVLAASPHPVQVSGGITTMDDLAALATAGAAGAVLGMALYTDTLDAEAVATAYGSDDLQEDA
ncbi:MAG: 1-(5-phosphoribosyl)-5-[(5-phosphoribosylamino)methylideneamino] imidazole-4-carboxamide isomerase [Gemmatimonadetes bacterium]|nr:1-(5-phosphoribosyl)-5-[(5-phosphoribosylamino)methylideneamino] imidazole-4-carboxamide isomerase [Gemmatimonadota bacterium]